jgi:hypothetical protein
MLSQQYCLSVLPIRIGCSAAKEKAAGSREPVASWILMVIVGLRGLVALLCKSLTTVQVQVHGTSLNAVSLFALALSFFHCTTSSALSRKSRA